MRIAWTEKAVSDLWAIGDYIAKDSPGRARTFVKKLLSRIQQVAKHPELGRIVPEFRDPTIRELIEGHYRIVYKTNTKRIIILQVFEGHKLITK